MKQSIFIDLEMGIATAIHISRSIKMKTNWLKVLKYEWMNCDIVGNGRVKTENHTCHVTSCFHYSWFSWTFFSNAAREYVDELFVNLVWFLSELWSDSGESMLFLNVMNLTICAVLGIETLSMLGATWWLTWFLQPIRRVDNKSDIAIQFSLSPTQWIPWHSENNYFFWSTMNVINCGDLLFSCHH